MAFDVWSISIIIIKFISYAATLLAAGSFLFALILKPNAKLSPKSWNILAIVLAILASFLLIPLNVGLFNDDGFSGMFDFEIFKIVKIWGGIPRPISPTLDSKSKICKIVNRVFPIFKILRI